MYRFGRSTIIFITLILIVVITAGCGDNSSSSGVQSAFSWSLETDERSIMRGDEASYTIKLSAISGMPHPRVLSLTVNDLPPELTASIFPNPILLPADSELTIGTGTSTPPGSYTFTIGNSVTEDTLQATLHVTPFEWNQVTVSGEGPPGLQEHSAVYDPETDSLIIFGGETDSGVLADLWVLNNVTDTGVGHSWEKVSFSGSRPSARYGHRAVYNKDNSRMIIWGGLVDPVGGIIEEDDRLWALTNANGVNGEPAWVDLTEDGVRPQRRAGFSAVYDSANNRMIVFGGANISGDETVLLNDIWVLTNADGSEDTSPAWQEITPSDGNIPYGRVLHSAVYDASSNRMIITGGRTANGVSSDIWILTNANGLGGAPSWIPVVVEESKIPPRAGHTSVYYPSSNRMVIFSGLGKNNTVLDDIWVLENANGMDEIAPSWVQKVTGHAIVSYPEARYNHIALGYADESQMLICGGLSEGSSYLNDVFILNHANGE